MMDIIDPHLHLFDLNRGEYNWIKAENPPNWPDKHLIQRNFAEVDLELSDEVSLSGFVHIEAGFDNTNSWREIDWLENSVTTPFKCIACLDLTLPSKNFSTAISKLKTYSSFVGIRHILDDDTLEILNNRNTKPNLAILEQHSLIFELQMPISDSVCTDKIVELLTDVPNLKLAINHGGWPPTSTDKSNTQYHQWCESLTKLSRFNNCVVKASGWEMLDRHYNESWQKRIIESLITILGPDRVLLASNFPLTLFSRSYAQLWQSYTALEDKELRRALCFDNARRFYGF